MEYDIKYVSLARIEQMELSTRTFIVFDNDNGWTMKVDAHSHGQARYFYTQEQGIDFASKGLSIRLAVKCTCLHCRKEYNGYPASSRCDECWMAYYDPYDANL